MTMKTFRSMLGLRVKKTAPAPKSNSPTLDRPNAFKSGFARVLKSNSTPSDMSRAFLTNSAYLTRCGGIKTRK